MKALVFPIAMYGCELDHKKAEYRRIHGFWTVVLEKTLESPLDCKEIKPVNPKGNQSWIFIGRTDAEAEAPILWPPDVQNWLVGKDPDAGKDWRWEEKGMTVDEMVRWHDQHSGCEFEPALGVDDGWIRLVCCSLCGCKELVTTEQLNWIVDLQCCTSSSCTAMWFSYTYTCIHSFSDTFLGSVQLLSHVWPVQPQGL